MEYFIFKITLLYLLADKTASIMFRSTFFYNYLIDTEFVKSLTLNIPRGPVHTNHIRL
jgi:hypothetical protein